MKKTGEFDFVWELVYARIAGLVFLTMPNRSIVSVQKTFCQSVKRTCYMYRTRVLKTGVYFVLVERIADYF